MSLPTSDARGGIEYILIFKIKLNFFFLGKKKSNRIFLYMI